MRNPNEVLKHLHEKAQDKSYKFQRLYRNLYNPEFYLLAYRNIYANGGSITPGVDGTSMDGLGLPRINKLILTLQDQSYHPQPARRTYIEKKSDPTKKRPLGIPSGNDKLVQEVIRMLLESIYEPSFLPCSHGSRPRRSCHTALEQIQKTFTGATWFLEGDITACFDSFDQHVLIELLRKRIDDEKFISLMWKLLKAGYMEQWNYHRTYTGTPQGSGMSPILANIYLHELDSFMGQYTEHFKVGDKMHRKTSSEYMRAANKLFRTKVKNAKAWSDCNEQERQLIVQEQRELRDKLLKTPRTAYCDASYKSLQYVRYADDWLCSVIGSKEDAERIKADIKAFLFEKLHLTLSEEKTKITHGSERARFLGYDITISHSNETKYTKRGHSIRAYNGGVRLYVPHEKMASKLLEYRAIRIKKYKDGKEKWSALQRGELINLTDIDILSKYNAEVRGMFNYYRLAHNVKKCIGNFAGLMLHSCLRTFGAKYRCGTKIIKQRYMRDGNFTVVYPTKQGLKQSVFCRNLVGERGAMFGQVDVLPAYKRYDRINILAARIKGKTCELCGKETTGLEIHQVKRLKDLRGNHPWELVMLDKRRRTLAVCGDCHNEIHNMR